MNLNDYPTQRPGLAPQPISIDVLCEKYAKGDETTIDDVQRRVARALAGAEPVEQREHFEAEFLRAMQRGFVPGGRINSAAGTGIHATLINCFVQPVGDSATADVDGLPSIFRALSEAAETMRRGGGVGYDFSRIRPLGALVHGTQSSASGPVSYMRLFDRSCETIESAGARRGAQMGVLRVDHPDVRRFVHAKDARQGGADLTNFNISVAVTDAFMLAVANGSTFELVHAARPGPRQIAAGAFQRQDGLWVYEVVSAAELYDEIMACTYDHADPGILFIDRLNSENNLAYCETIECLNPCGEEPLPAYGCCCLGSIDLTRFVDGPFSADASFAWRDFDEVVAVAVRMLDNVLDVTHWPLEAQRDEAMAKRRIGLGFMGLGSAMVMLGIAYGSGEGNTFAAEVARHMRNAAYSASARLADVKGAFPLFDGQRFLEGPFAQRLDAELREEIAGKGLRNSHLLSIAPTGTIALAFGDNVSNGIEPAFSWIYERRKRMGARESKTYTVEDHAHRLYRALGGDVSCLPSFFVAAHDLSAEGHLSVLAAVQPFVDAAISKTVNVPVEYPYDRFKDLYVQAWAAGLKGLATYRPNAVTGAVLSVPSASPQTASQRPLEGDDPLRKPVESRPDGVLEGITTRVRYWTKDGARSIYLVVNFMNVEGMQGGRAVSVNRPVEFFMPASQAASDQQWVTSTMKLMSMAARAGAPIEKILDQLRGAGFGPVRYGSVTRGDGTVAPRYHDSETAAIAHAIEQVLVERGFLDDTGRQVPLAQLVIGRQAELVPEVPVIAGALEDGITHFVGKPCGDCGAHAVQRVDGCDRCANCGAIGSCG